MSLNIDIAAGLGGSGDPGGALAGGGGTDPLGTNTVSQSMRLNGSNGYLSKNDFGTATDTSKRTFSTWIKRATPTAPAAYNHIIGAAASGIDGFGFASGTEKLQWIESGANTYDGVRQLRDTTAWYHLFTTYNATDNELYIYVNGELDYYRNASLSALTKLCNTGHTTYIGKRSNVGTYIHGYLAETVFLDGTIGDVNDFGEYINGVWVSKSISDAGLTFGDNGFYLDYADKTDFGKDVSGKGNHFTSTNIDQTDQVPDSPSNNFYTMNPLMQPETAASSSTYPEGATGYRNSSGSYQNGGYSTAGIPSYGKWYFEVYVKTVGGSPGIGFHTIDRSIFSDYRGYFDFTGPGSYSNQMPVYNNTGKIYYGPTSGGNLEVTGQNTWTTGDVIQVFVDVVNNEVYFGKNNTWQNSADPNAGTGGLSMGLSDPSAGRVVHAMALAYNSGEYIFNFGQDDSFGNNKTTGSTAATDANNIGNFYYTPPTDALALCTSNLNAPAIGPNQDAGLQVDDHFETVLYTGSGGTQHIGSGGLQHPQDTVSIANSLRFDENSSLHYDITSDGDKRTWTFSAWVKRTELGASNGYYIFSDGQSSNFTNIFLKSDGKIYAQLYESTGPSVKQKTSTKTFNSLNTWYHIVWRVDTTQATDSDRSRVYVNGTQITAWDTEQHVDQNDETTMNVSGKDFLIGAYSTSSTSRHFAGYMAEINFIDGQSYGPEYFGQVGSNGYWIPKSLSGVSYGSNNNSFRLDFADSSALGDDESGNANDFDVTDNIDAHDQVGDSPTQNFVNLGAVLSVDTNGGPTHREGNLQAYDSASACGRTRFQLPETGKWYFEAKVTSGAGVRLGVADESVTVNTTNFMGVTGNVAGNYYINTNGTGASINAATGVALDGGSSTFSGQPLTNPVGVFVNMDDREISFQCDRGSGLETIGPFTLSHDKLHAGYNFNGDVVTFNFGQDSTFAGNESTGGSNASDANSAGSFFYTVPTDALALMDDNIPQEGINSPDWVWIKNRTDASTAHSLFNTIMGPELRLSSSSTTGEQTKTGTLTSFDYQGFTTGDNDITNKSGSSFVAWMWKAGGPSPTRTYTVKVDADASDGDQNKYLFDGNTTIYAPTLTLQPGGTYIFDQSDSSNSGHPLRFSTTSDGTHGGGSEYITGVTTAGTPGTDGTTTIVLASDAPTLYYYCSVHSGMGGQVTPNTKHGSSNFKGGKESIVTANETAGFSIASYVGDHTAAGLSGRPVGHGLLKQTEFTLIKDRGNNSNNDNWSLSSTHIGDDYIYWTSMNPTGTAQVYPTSGDDETVTVGISGTTAATRTSNEDNHDFIMYNFHSVDGYCKLGSYEGNGIADGPFVYTGFKPRWVMIKCYEGTGNWFILDSVRSPINEMDDRLDADLDNAEGTANADIDFLSTGFKIRTASTAGINQNNDGHFYIAFAECPFKYATAR